MSARMAGIVAAAALALLVASGAAQASLHFEPGGSVIAPSLGSTTFEAGSLAITCPVTLEKRFESEVEAVPGGAMGEVTWVAIGEASCTGGRISAALSLPWPITFNELTETGIEATIEQVALQVRFVILGVEVTCLYRGDVPELIGNLGDETDLLTLLPATLPLESGSGLCPTSGEWLGTFAVEPRQTVLLYP